MTTTSAVSSSAVSPSISPDATPVDVNEIFATPRTNAGMVMFDKILAKRRMGATLTADQAKAVLALSAARYDYKDLPVDGGALRMRADTGALVHVDRPHLDGIFPTYTALGHMVSLWDSRPRALAGVMADLPPKERAEVFNHYAVRNARARQDKDGVVIRTFKTETGRRAARAIVSPKYRDVTPSTLLETLRTTGVDTFLVRVSPEVTAVEGYIPGMKADLGRGDIVCARALVRDNHVRGGSILTEGGFLRLVCLNGATVMEGGRASRIRHVGNAKGRLEDARVQVEASFRAATGLLRRAADVRFPEGWDRAKVLEVVGEVVPSLDAAAISAAWDQDGELSRGDTLAGLHNAVTRAAQGLDVVDALEVEAVATDLLAQGWNALDASLPRLEAATLM